MKERMVHTAERRARLLARVFVVIGAVVIADMVIVAFIALAKHKSDDKGVDNSSSYVDVIEPLDEITVEYVTSTETTTETSDEESDTTTTETTTTESETDTETTTSVTEVINAVPYKSAATVSKNATVQETMATTTTTDKKADKKADKKSVTAAQTTTQSSTTVADCSLQYYSEQDIIDIAKVLYRECGSLPSKTEQACVAWTILNRCDNWGKTVYEVVRAPYQYTFRKNSPVKQALYDLAKDVLDRWSREKNGETDVGRVLPREYMWFWGDGRHNHFRNAYKRPYTVWHYTLPSPYDS